MRSNTLVRFYIRGHPSRPVTDLLRPGAIVPDRNPGGAAVHRREHLTLIYGQFLAGSAKSEEGRSARLTLID